MRKNKDKRISLREVKAVEVIKGDIAVNESFQMAEKCVLLEDGTLVMHEDCYPMQKGDYYLVFLSPSGYPGRPLLAHSADNGKCDLSNLYLNSDWRKQLFVEACADIWPGKQSAVSEIEGFIQAEIRSESELVPGDTWESIMVTTPYTEQGKEIIIEICHKDNQTIYRTGDCYYAK